MFRPSVPDRGSGDGVSECGMSDLRSQCPGRGSGRTKEWLLEVTDNQLVGDTVVLVVWFA